MALKTVKNCLTVRDVVHTDEAGAPGHGRSQSREGAYIPFSRGQASQEMAQKGFAGGTDEEGATEIQEDIQVVEDFQIVLKGFAETQARVQDQKLFRKAPGQGKIKAFLKEGAAVPR